MERVAIYRMRIPVVMEMRDMKKWIGMGVIGTVVLVAVLMINTQGAIASHCHNNCNDNDNTGNTCPIITWMKCCITFPTSCGQEPTITCEPAGDECVSSCSDGQFCWCVPSWE